MSEIYRRLRAAPAVSDAAEALRMVAEIINHVEDTLTLVPYNPEHWRHDGRIYPPQPDSEREVEGHPAVKRYRTRKHNLYVGSNGAIEIQQLDGTVELVKPGADGRRVWEL